MEASFELEKKGTLKKLTWSPTSQMSSGVYNQHFICQFFQKKKQKKTKKRVTYNKFREILCRYLFGLDYGKNLCPAIPIIFMP
jgi:plasmid rolling circle replication initiator protein Rep